MQQLGFEDARLVGVGTDEKISIMRDDERLSEESHVPVLTAVSYDIRFLLQDDVVFTYQKVDNDGSTSWAHVIDSYAPVDLIAFAITVYLRLTEAGCRPVSPSAPRQLDRRL